MSKATILRDISNALKQNPLSVEKAHYTDIIIPVEQDPIAEYKRLQALNRAVVIECSKEEIASKINEVATKENITETLIPQSLMHLDLSIQKVCYDKTMEEMKDILFEIPCSVVEADYGVANLGITSMVSSSNQPRLASLITRCCVILLDKNKIKPNMSAVLCDVKAKYPQALPSNILFIAGPSRTADIELQVVFGVHGPQVVYVVLY
ncbi:hypothetical protein BBW65_05920 [Helicobacter enhydrae]|uniref:LUD domain-containing protein n=1 Tax=Helicobacter enhydrae TaxID=222136 RepID=A0A1B1U6N7_9HELI|nr:LUD domain-containing protein [Helicobacter enhydrae]ANV98362.1 hypothetical protein BBW65_05920 [Helicobacter enhydrae]